MSHSTSSLNTFANCMAKYEHNYILHTEPDKPLSPHFSFGSMAHEVMYNAGKLRDDTRDGVVNDEDYYSIIPSEVLYEDLKTEFGINNWEEYFTPIIKQTYEYEKELTENFIKEYKDCRIERELKLSLTPDELSLCGYSGITQPLVGIIDCLIIKDDTAAIILDYKFSTTKKTQDDFDMNSQLPLYAFLIHYRFGVPLRNIQYGYIDIPKQMFGKPALLTNGTLSRAKSQNVSQELYEKAVKELHGNDDYYNCEEGGYYYDCWCNLALNKCAYLSLTYLDIDTYNGVLKDLFNAAKMVDMMQNNKLPFLRKYDSYSCKGCEYLHSCKPWLTVNGE